MMGFRIIIITDGRRGYFTRVVQPDIEFAWLKAKRLLPDMKTLAVSTYGNGPWTLVVQSGDLRRAEAV